MGGEPNKENCKEQLEGECPQRESVKTLPNESSSLKDTPMYTEKEKTWNKLLSAEEAKTLLRSLKGGDLV